MSDSFNVFDEWGNKVGEYTPTGGGANSLFLFLAILLLWTIGFAVYTVVRLTVKGFEALVKQDYKSAFKYLIVPGTIILMILCQIGFVMVGSQMGQSNLCSRIKVQVEGNRVLVRDTMSWTGYDSLTSMVINGNKQRVDRVGSQGRWIDAGEPIVSVILEWINPVQGPLVTEGELCNLHLYP